HPRPALSPPPLHDALPIWAASYEELNAWLLDRCVAYAKAHKHPELTDCTIWQAFEAERSQLVQITGPFDGFHATQASVSKTCLADRKSTRLNSSHEWISYA